MSENGKQGLAIHTQNDPRLPVPQITKPIICSCPESPIPRRAAFSAVKRQGGTSRSRGNVVPLHAMKKCAALSPLLSVPIQGVHGWDGGLRGKEEDTFSSEPVRPLLLLLRYSQPPVLILPSPFPSSAYT